MAQSTVSIADKAADGVDADGICDGLRMEGVSLASESSKKETRRCMFIWAMRQPYDLSSDWERMHELLGY